MREFPTAAPLKLRRRTDDGASMLGILSIVVILGLLVVIPLSLNLGSSSTTTTTTPGATTTTAPKTVASGATEAEVAACRADFESIDQAVSTYRALNGSNPPTGTAWATSTTNGGPFLQSWPAATKWSFTWNGTTLNVSPRHGLSAHGSYGTTTAKSGCFAASP